MHNFVGKFLIIQYTRWFNILHFAWFAVAVFFDQSTLYRKFLSRIAVLFLTVYFSFCFLKPLAFLFFFCPFFFHLLSAHFVFQFSSPHFFTNSLLLKFLPSLTFTFAIAFSPMFDIYFQSTSCYIQSDAYLKAIE